MSVIVSCKKDNEILINKDDYLIFGHSYGFCVGEECIETFKLSGEKLFEDLNDNYNQTEKFNFIELGEDKFNEVKDLIDLFPTKLLSENAIRLGCPDCADQGGLLIIYYKNGKLNKWIIDQDKRSIPDYLHDFIDNVNDKIRLINK